MNVSGMRPIARLRRILWRRLLRETAGDEQGRAAKAITAATRKRKERPRTNMLVIALPFLPLLAGVSPHHYHRPRGHLRDHPAASRVAAMVYKRRHPLSEAEPP